MALGAGLEPAFSDSKSDVLPVRRPQNKKPRETSVSRGSCNHRGQTQISPPDISGGLKFHLRLVPVHGAYDKAVKVIVKLVILLLG